MKTILLTLNGIFLVVSIYYIVKILICASIIPIRRQDEESPEDEVIRGNDYPAFWQQTDFCGHTITLCMNFSTADWFQFACERACFERDYKCDYDAEKKWNKCARRLWEILNGFDGLDEYECEDA